MYLVQSATLTVLPVALSTALSIAVPEFPSRS
jgi:hypothetical protein